MPRIFKGSGSTLRLLIHKCVDYSTLSNLKVVLYTTDPEIAVQVNEGIVVEGNKVIFTLPSTAFAYMDDGVINYIIEGFVNNDFFSTERQSDYYLKTPTSYIAEGGSYQEKYLNIHANGLYEVVPDEGKDAMTKVSVNVDVQPNLGQLNADFVDYDGEGNYWRYGFDDGFDGFNYIKINASAYGEQKRNEGYGQGHSDGIIEGVEVGKIQAGAEAITLDVIGNGTVYTKYSDNIPEFNEPLTGDDFYSYMYLESTGFSTKYTLQEDTEIELWVMYDETFTPNSSYPPMLIGDTNYFKIGWHRGDSSNRTWVLDALTPLYFTLEANIWHKINYSYINGLWVDDEFIGIPTFYDHWIGESININGGSGSNLYYGMLKINGDRWYPSPLGFESENGEFLKGQTDKITYVPKDQPVIYDNLFKEINVDVPIILGNTKIKLTNSQFTKIPKVKSDGLTDMKEMFKGCTKCADVSNLAHLDTKYVTTMDGCFYSFGTGIMDMSPLSNWNTSNVTTFSSMFMSTSCIEDCSFMANWDTSNVKAFNSWFYYSNGQYHKVRYIPVIKADSATNLSMIFSNDTQPTTSLEYFGGFQNMKCNWNDNRGLSATPNLTYESCISILNCLYDFTGNGLTPTSSQGNLKVHQNFLDLVGEEISIGTNKGWTITA